MSSTTLVTDLGNQFLRSIQTLPQNNNITFWIHVSDQSYPWEVSPYPLCIAMSMVLILFLICVVKCCGMFRSQSLNDKVSLCCGKSILFMAVFILSLALIPLLVMGQATNIEVYKSVHDDLIPSTQLLLNDIKALTNTTDLAVYNQSESLMIDRIQSDFNQYQVQTEYYHGVIFRVLGAVLWIALFPIICLVIGSFAMKPG
eukprot:717215_1